MCLPASVLLPALDPAPAPRKESGLVELVPTSDGDGLIERFSSGMWGQRLSCDALYILYAVYHLYVCNNVIINNKKCEENINISTNNVFVHLMDLMVGNTTAFCKSNSGYRSIKFQYCCGQILTNITWQATLARWRCTPTSPRSGAARTRATSSTSTGGSPGCNIISTWYSTILIS